MVRTTLIHSNSSASLASVPSSHTVLGLSPDGSAGGRWEKPKKETSNCCTSFLKETFKRKNIERKLPILKWLPQYTVQKALADLVAGITVGLTVLPQGLAYATVAGLPPIYGLYSAFVGVFVYIFFGSTRFITVGPTAILSVMNHKYVHGKPPEYAIFLSAVVGVVCLLMGILRLGFIANFVSRPVMSGFTSGVALTIVATQMSGLCGIKIDGEGFLATFESVAEQWHEIKTNDVILGFICIGILIFLKYLNWMLSPILKGHPKLDKGVWFFATARSAIVLTACTLYTYSQEVNGVVPFTIVGKVPAGIPEFKLPPTSIFDPATNTTHTFTDILREEASALIVMPVLGLMEHYTIAKAFSGTKRVDATQEVLCIGITNCISCFFNSYASAGCFSRTVINTFSGVETPMGGLYVGIIVLLALQFLTGYFYYIPKPSLAAVIISSVIFMLDPSIILPLWRSKRMDLVPWIITFLITILVGLEFGILTGFCISATYLLYYAARPRVNILEAETSRQGSKFIMIVLDRSLTFPSVDYITYEINKSIVRFGNKKTPAVIDCNHIQYTDFTAAEAMKGMMEALHEQEYSVIFYRLKPSMLRIVEGVMTGSSIHFVHCESETDLEALIDDEKWSGTDNTGFIEVDCTDGRRTHTN